jgi:hypothetical protein
MTDSEHTEKPNHYEKIGDQVAIFQRGGRWYANFQQHGKQVRQSLKTTSKKQARQKAIRLEAALQDGTYGRPKKAPPMSASGESILVGLDSLGRSLSVLKESSYG